MYCRECGHELREDSKFCMKCGTKVILEMENKSIISTTNNNTNNNNTTNNNTTYTTNNANNNVAQSMKVSQKSWYEEIGAIKYDVNKYIGNSGNESNIYLFMTISLIWLALSCFMPIAEVLYGEYSFFGISNALNELADWGVKVGFYIFITFLCKISYIIGVVLLICYILKVLKLEKNKLEICDTAFVATIALSIPTVAVFIGKILINSKGYKYGDKLVSLTVFAWISLIVMIINIIVSHKFSETYYSNRSYVDNIVYEERICMMCKTRYSASSCPTCGSSLIVK